MRSIYRRGNQFVFVRPVRLSGSTRAEVGAPVPPEMRRYHVISLYRRGLIGTVGDPWTDNQLRARGAVLPDIEGAPSSVATTVETVEVVPLPPPSEAQAAALASIIPAEG